MLLLLLFHGATSSIVVGAGAGLGVVGLLIDGCDAGVADCLSHGPLHDGLAHGPGLSAQEVE